MKFTPLILLSAALLTLPACDTVDRLMGSLDDTARSPESHLVREPTSNALINDCPDVKIVDELSMLTEFTNAAMPDDSNTISRAHVSMGESTCTYTERSVTMDVKLVFDSELGPRAKVKDSDTPFVSYPFFVAVTDEDGRILAKEVFAASMTYASNEKTHTYTENIRQVVPLRRREDGRDHKVLIGFQLTAEQLAFNRRFMAMHAPLAPVQQAPAAAPPISIMRQGY